MRTTLTLDDDVAARLEQVSRKHRQPLKVVVNEALRAGLPILERPSRPRRAFRTTGFDLGPSLVGSLDNVEEILSRVEGEEHR
jgi:predicted transcriptional regulator